jgi:peptidoglycan/LPS O-acetylase OafA/YrhL
MPGLDVLRGIAVLSVVMYHGLHWFLPLGRSISPAVRRLSAITAPGWLGVNLFFVLSGFLITGILLDTRTRPHYWKSFYTRRILRILPLYLVVLVILRFWPYGGVDWRYLLLCLLYLANFASVRRGVAYGPLWSLAVEEQFYLVWPFLVRRLSPRTLAIVCLASIFLSPVLRFVSASGILPLGDPYSATWLVTDNLATGALIAILLRTRAATLARIRTWTLGAVLMGIALLAFGFWMHFMSRGTAGGAAFQTEPFLLLFAALLLLSLRYGSLPGVMLVTRPLRFFGYISYGLYLFHVIGFGVYQSLFEYGHPIPAQLTLGQILLRFFSVLAATTLFCYLSRRYFEEYFLRMKDRLVPYASPKQPRSAESP